MRFIKRHKDFKLILENKQQALKVLKEKSISKTNKDFTELSSLLLNKFNNNTLLGLMTTYLLDQKVSMDEIRDLIRWIHENKGGKLLPNNILTYKSFERLKDDITNINIDRKVKLVVKELPSKQKNLYKNMTTEEKETFEGWCIKMFEIKYKEPFFSKISKSNSVNELLEHIEDFVRRNSNIKSYKDKITEIRNTKGCELMNPDEETGIIVDRVKSFPASQALGSSA